MAKIVFEGNFGNDPKEVTMENGKTFVSVSVAEQIRYLDTETNEWETARIDWHNVVIFSPKVKQYALNMRKGSRVKIEGDLSYRFAGVNDDGYDIQSANIVATRIELAPLVSKADSVEIATV